MSAKKTSKIRYYFITTFCSILFWFVPNLTKGSTSTPSYLTPEYIATQLGWITDYHNYCGGYFLDQAFPTPDLKRNNAIEITTHEGLITQRHTSILEGDVTLTRLGQQVIANKMFLNRDPTTFKLSTADMIGNVRIREPNSLIIGKRGQYNFNTHEKSLIHVSYRTSFDGKDLLGPHVTAQQMEKPHKITAMTAWGKAHHFSQTQPRVYELTNASYSTCPPIAPIWRVKAKHIVLNKNTGRGYATHARLLIKEIPVFYIPYINFSIDNKRKSGLLWPTVGVNNKYGPYFLAPIYWNIAPNEDMTITPGFLSKRGLQLSDQFRYLTYQGEGMARFSILPGDQFFANFKDTQQTKYGNYSDPSTKAELNRLLNSSNTRKAFSWVDRSRFNDNWFSHIDFNYAGDDYYLRDFGSNLNEISANQLLQEGELNYKNQH